MKGKALTREELELLARHGFRVREDGRLWDEDQGHEIHPARALLIVQFRTEEGRAP